MLNPVHLATLQAVLDGGSFVAAAQRLGYTASAVSQQMRALERATGLALFERLPRTVRPTAAAHYLADAGRETVLGLRSLEHDARAMASAERGHVDVGSFRTASARILPAAFAGFTGERPAVTVRLTEGEPDALLPSLLDGSLDLAVVYENELDARDWPRALTRVPLFAERRLLLAPPALRPATGRAHLADLRDRTWIASDPSPSLERYCAGAGFTPSVALQTNDYYSVCAFVHAGLGIALVPAMGHYLAADLPPIELYPPPPKRHVFVLHRASNQNPLLAPLIAELRAATP
ncbi:MAG TPA: LysR family transcriptional regulator [Streptosporangiaceae bacterium]|jgi:DNA-binding transcriptional LysR family regulator